MFLTKNGRKNFDNFRQIGRIASKKDMEKGTRGSKNAIQVQLTGKPEGRAPERVSLWSM